MRDRQTITHTLLEHRIRQREIAESDAPFTLTLDQARDLVREYQNVLQAYRDADARLTFLAWAQEALETDPSPKKEGTP